MLVERSRHTTVLCLCFSATTMFCTPLAPQESRIERAYRIPPAQCEDSNPTERAAQILGTRGLLGVELSSAPVRTAKGYEASRPRGIELRYAAPPAVTAAWFQRELECHQADVALGRVSARDDDPYVSPDEWLTLEVATIGSALVVRISADRHEATEAVLERARRLQRSQAR